MRHRFEHLEALSSQEGFWDDQEAAQKLLQERSGLESRMGAYEKLSDELAALPELVEMAASELDEDLLSEVEGQLPELESRLRKMELARMLSGPEDGANAIVTIHPGAGGVDAQDWAEILMRMYLRWCDSKGYKVEILHQAPGDEAGIKEVSFAVRGESAYGYLRAESGVHRLIRISPFDSNARRHTSFAALFVVPELEDDDTVVEIRPEDLRVDTYRASGAGGQHVNRTESAIRLTHLATGVVVQCQAERSQHKNRATAMKMLRGRLYELQRQEREKSFEEAYGSDRMEIGFGSQVRSYTLQPYTMVKDERTGHKSSRAQAVLDGDLDEFVESYLIQKSNRTATKEKNDGD